MKEKAGVYSKPASFGETFSEALLRKKPVEKSLAENTSEKTLKWYDLTAYGVAATVGSGIYASVGKVAKNGAGVGVTASTIVAGLLSLLTGICYLEFASALPISGSGYAYFYALMGEFLGWFIGWNLTLEYGFAAAAISDCWTAYLEMLVSTFGLTLPKWCYLITPFGEDSMFRVNLMAGLIILLLGFVVSRGAKFGTLLTNTVTIMNISIILGIVLSGAFYVEPANWVTNKPKSLSSIGSGAGRMFFAYIGYDTVSTLATEAANPTRDIPIAICLTVGIATLLYVLVGVVITGMVDVALLKEDNPLIDAFNTVGSTKIGSLISFLALLMMAATMFTCVSGQSKIFQAISKDGLLPKAFSRENSKGTPLFSVVATTGLLASVATFVNADRLNDMIVFGTLLAMSMLCIGVLVVRFENCKSIKVAGTRASVAFMLGSLLSSFLFHQFSFWVASLSSMLTMVAPFIVLVYQFFTHPDQLASKSKAFSCPIMPLIPCLAVACNSYVMMGLASWVVLGQFLVWTALGLAIYFLYGIKNSYLGHPQYNA